MSLINIKKQAIFGIRHRAIDNNIVVGTVMGIKPIFEYANNSTSLSKYLLIKQL